MAKALLPVAEALANVLDGVQPTAVERVPLPDAFGRTLAEPLVAKLTQPPFDASAMDGWAVRAADIAIVPAQLAVAGQSAAGVGFGGVLQPTQAVRILTGAPVPHGADTVVIQENADLNGNTVIVRELAVIAANIRPRGGDFVAGDEVLMAGRAIDARALALAAAAGHSDIPVHARPRVAILATGDELVPPGVTPGPDQIVSSNVVALAAMIRAAGGMPVDLGIAPDNEEAIAQAIAKAGNADILVTTGGASVGDHDLVKPVLEAAGAKLGFWKIAMRPGKPLIFGRLGPTRVLGLPGNPVSALVCARVFLVPLIQRLLGRHSTASQTVTALLTEPLDANSPRTHYMRAELSVEHGNRVVTPCTSQDSSLLTVLAKANALIVREPDAAPAARGDSVTVLPLDF